MTIKAKASSADRARCPASAVPGATLRRFWLVIARRESCNLVSMIPSLRARTSSPHATLTEQGDRCRQSHGPDDRSVDRDRRCETDAELLELQQPERREHAEHTNHHERRAGHRAAG